MTSNVNGSSAQPAWHGRFLQQLLPAVRSHARFAFRHLNPEARQEAVSEAIAAALVAYVRLVERGKEDVVYAKPLAHYAVCHVRNGRHVGGCASSTDALSRQAQRRRGFRVGRIGGVDEHEDKWVERIVVEDRRATPADIAATRIDFHNWLNTLSKRNGNVAQALATGETTNTVAAAFGRGPSLSKHWWESPLTTSPARQTLNHENPRTRGRGSLYRFGRLFRNSIAGQQPTAAEWMKEVLGVDTNHCPCCGERLFCERLLPRSHAPPPHQTPLDPFPPWDTS